MSLVQTHTAEARSMFVTYLTSYQTVETMLNIPSQISIKDLAVRFGCLEAKILADTLLEIP